MSGLGWPDPPADADVLRSYLNTLRVDAVRTLAGPGGMRYRNESRKAEIIEHLVRYEPDMVRGLHSESKGNG